MPNSWSWVQFSDIHLGSPRSFRFQPKFNEQFDFAVEQIANSDQEPDFIIVSGDMCRDGDTHLFELEAAYDRLQQLPWPVYCLPGNHDIGGRFHEKNHARVNLDAIGRYRQVFGDDYYTFEHKGVRFICLDSMIFGTGFDAEKEQWQWIDEQAKDAHIPTMVFMHTLPFTNSPGSMPCTFEENFSAWYGNIPEEDQLRLAAFLKSINLLAISTGHIHVFQDRVVDGIRHVQCPSTAFLGNPEYLKEVNSVLGFLHWDMDDAHANVSLRQLEKESALEGYGPGGNIPVPERDYSAAWER